MATKIAEHQIAPEFVEWARALCFSALRNNGGNEAPERVRALTDAADMCSLYLERGPEGNSDDDANSVKVCIFEAVNAAAAMGADFFKVE